MSHAPTADRAAITAGLKTLIGPGSVFEIRAPKVPQRYGRPCTLSGYFDYDHIEQAADAILTKCDGAPGVYVTINPCKPELLARCMYRLERAGEGERTRDHEIESRQWLIVDLDSNRPTGICATDEEKAAAAELRETVHQSLSADGWPDPVVMDSGNGFYLFYRVELPTDDGGIIDAVLKGMGARFDTKQVHVDLTMHNASRVIRIPGTVNRKGDNAPTRPHRPAVLLSSPATLHPVPVKLLQAIGTAPETPQKGRKTKAATVDKGRAKRRRLFGWTVDHVEQLISGGLAECGPGQRTEYEGGYKWKLDRCPFNSAHTDSAAIFYKDSPGFNCFHNSCSGHNFESLLELLDQRGVEMPEINQGFVAKNYYGNAQQFVAEKYPAGDQIGLLHYDGAFRKYVGTHYAEHDDAALRAAEWRWLSAQQVASADGAIEDYQPTTNAVNNTLDAIKAICNFPRDIRPPCWLPGHNGPDAEKLLPFSNTLLHLSTGNTYPHTPGLFITHALPFDYDPEATAPEWENFLRMLWPDDPEAIATLKLLFGYILGGGTYLQKIFLLVGPKRGGKGTIARILVALLGPDACCGPTLAGLAGGFGLQTLIGKRLAVVSDARLSSRADQAAITERLLTISGEDTITVPRKYATDWTGQLPTRFLLLSNELPRLSDSSGALASRFVVLTMMQSFYGREDHSLAAKLLRELPGIANWAIEGWRQLQTVGRIDSPTSARESIEELTDLGSPIGAFIRDCCEIGPEHEIERKELYGAWCNWCDTQGRQHPGTAESFGRDLRAALPAIKTAHHRTDEGRIRFYQGIATVIGGAR